MMRLELNRREIVAGGLAALTLPALPAAAQAVPELTFLVLGDWGRRGDPKAKPNDQDDADRATQRTVAAAMAARAKAIKASFVVTVGDNFYDVGVASTKDSHWQDSYRGVYDLDTLSLWYPALGNHDHNGVPKAQLDYNDGKTPWKLRTEADPALFANGKPYAYYYKQRVALAGGRNLDLFILDTSPLADPTKYPSTAQQQAAQRAWFETVTKASDATWKLAVGHHPAYSSGASQSRRAAYKDFLDWIRPSLKAGGVQAYIAGHDHHLEHLVDRNGVTHVISGGGSQGDPLAKDFRDEGHMHGWSTPGFTAYEIAGDVLTIRYVDNSGVDLCSQAIVKGL